MNLITKEIEGPILKKNKKKITSNKKKLNLETNIVNNKDIVNNQDIEKFKTESIKAVCAWITSRPPAPERWNVLILFCSVFISFLKSIWYFNSPPGLSGIGDALLKSIPNSYLSFV